MKKYFPFLLTLFVPFLLYGQIYNDYIGAGHDQGVIVTSSSQQNGSQRTINGSGFGKDLAGASRFMSHATLGATLEDIRYADSIGYTAWLEEQFDLPATSYTATIDAINDITYDIYIDLGGDPEEYRATVQQFRFAWSHVAQTAPDVLRQKVALALSEILVISSDSDLSERGFGLASYYDVLSEQSFGNYKDLLMEVTLHPMMGFYLSHYNNPKTDEVNNIHPDENYAREIMQLFSIGLYELNIDGTRQLDGDGNYIPTYDNNDIKELAKVFTGLSMTDWIIEGIPQDPQFGLPFYYIDPTLPMTMYEDFHEPGAKTIVGDYTINETDNGLAEIELAVEHIFNHPNVGPFVSSRLIQRLIKSNPTPEYVARIATIFNDNGNGVRGDMKSVVEAILMDVEARDCEWINHPSNGRLKEPIHRYTQLTKALRAETSSGWFWNQGYAFEYLVDQFPMHSPTVFNFYLPDYNPNGDFANENLVGPEFQIFNSSTSAAYLNYTYYMTLVDYYNEVPEDILGDMGAGVLEDYQAYLVIPDLENLDTKPDAVVDYLDLVLAHGNMSEETREAIRTPAGQLVDFPEFLLKLSLYLTMISPDFVIMK